MEGDTNVVTQGTNDRGSDMNKGRGKGTPKQGEYQGRKNSFGDKPSYSKTAKNGNSQSRYGKPDGTSNNFNKSDRFDKPKNYNSTPRFPNKDDDEEDNSRRSKPSRPKESKPGVAIPDKNKVQLRLEKEQKSMKKKQQSKKKESSRPQPKMKRSNNVNYIKNYANGDYDEYYDM